MHCYQHPAHFWTEVDAACEALQAAIYLPSDIESHLQRTSLDDDHPQSYHSQLRAALQSAESLFQADNEAYQAEKAFQALDTELKSVEQDLISLVSSLERSSAALRNAGDRCTQLKRNMLIAADEAHHITDFVEAFDLPDSLRPVIESSHPHSNEFKQALALLSQALTSCHVHKDALLVREIQPDVLSLRDLAIRRIDDRFRESLRLMRDPSSSFMILRDALLLKQRPLMDFLNSHAHALFESLTKEYVEVAKLAFDVYVQSYYHLLALCRSNSVLAKLPSVGSETSKIFSSIWDNATAASNPPYAGGEHKRHSLSESMQEIRENNEDIDPLSSECDDALRDSLNPPLTVAELRLEGNGFNLRLNRLFRELTASFLSYEKSESKFMAEMFGAYGRNFLPDIFSDKDNPVLSCLEECFHTPDSRSEPEQLCLSLYVCRRIRESITTQQGVDHRVTFFVLAEKMIQTRFQSVLESITRAARERLLKEKSNAVTANTASPGLTSFCSLVSNLLVIAQQGDKWIRSQDVGYALRRRLQSCLDMVHATADTDPVLGR